MRQPVVAPIAAGGGVVGGVAAVLVSGYFLVDCFRYESGRGACDDAVRQHTLPLVAGAAAIAGTLGGLFTYNRRLDRPDRQGESEPKTTEAEQSAPSRWGPAEASESFRQAFTQSVAEGVVEPLPVASVRTPVDPRREVYISGSTDAGVEPWAEGTGIERMTPVEDLVLRLCSRGFKAESIALQVGVDTERVRSILATHPGAA
jgi:hypothetical protein